MSSPWFISRLVPTRGVTDSFLPLGSMSVKLSISFARRFLRRSSVGSFPFFASLTRRLATLLIVMPWESCSSSAYPPCLGSSRSSQQARLTKLSRSFTTESSLPGSLLLVSRVRFLEDLQDRSFYCGISTSDDLPYGFCLIGSLSPSLKKGNPSIFSFSKVLQVHVWVDLETRPKSPYVR